MLHITFCLRARVLLEKRVGEGWGAWGEELRERLSAGKAGPLSRRQRGCSSPDILW